MDFSKLNAKFQKIILAIVLISTGCIMIMFSFDDDLIEQNKSIGFIILGDINEEGWNSSQYNGIKNACDKYKLKLIVRDKVKENSGQCTEAIKELADEGCGMIFLASYSYSTEAQNLVGKCPNISFATNSAEVHARNMTAYFLRVYQGRYLAGALAGMRTKSNVIGYVAAMSNSEVNRQINAFTIGVKKTNPNAKVIVKWTGSWQDEEKEIENAKKLIQAGADVLTYHQDESSVADTAESLGVNYIMYNAISDKNSPQCLATVICQWDSYYVDILQRYLKGELNAVKNHWIGIERDAVMLTNFSDTIDLATRLKIKSLQAELINDQMIFANEIYDNQNNLRCANGEVISDDVLLERINWLVRGVEVLD